MPAIPNCEPASVTAGDTLAWTRTLQDYPASAWTLKYALQCGGATPLAINATTAGDAFAVNVTAATSADYPPGCYAWTAYVEQGADRHTVGRGTLTILPSPLAAVPQTHAARMLGLIQQALEGRIPNGLESTDIDGQRLDLIKHNDLIRLESYYSARVAGEKARFAMQTGGRNPRNSFAAFRRPR